MPPGSDIDGSGVDGGFITIQSSGVVDIQRGSGSGKIDVSGTGTPGTISIIAIGNVTNAGNLTADQLAPGDTSVPNRSDTQPSVLGGSCLHSRIAFSPLLGHALDQRFRAVLFGDCSGNRGSSGGGSESAEKKGRHRNRPLDASRQSDTSANSH